MQNELAHYTWRATSGLVSSHGEREGSNIGCSQAGWEALQTAKREIHVKLISLKLFYIRSFSILFLTENWNRRLTYSSRGVLICRLSILKTQPIVLDASKFLDIFSIAGKSVHNVGIKCVKVVMSIKLAERDCFSKNQPLVTNQLGYVFFAINTSNLFLFNRLNFF